MIRRLTTESGSIYELDEDGKRVRMVVGEPSAVRIGGTWRAYDHATVLDGRLAVSFTGESKEDNFSMLTSKIRRWS